MDGLQVLSGTLVGLDFSFSFYRSQGHTQIQVYALFWSMWELPPTLKSLTEITQWIRIFNDKKYFQKVLEILFVFLIFLYFVFLYSPWKLRRICIILNWLRDMNSKYPAFLSEFFSDFFDLSEFLAVLRICCSLLVFFFFFFYCFCILNS